MTDSIAPAGVTPTAAVVSQAQPVSSEPSDATVVTNASIPTTEAIASPPGEPTNSASEPKKSRAEERIQELVAERNAAKEYAEYWRAETLKVARTRQPDNQTPAPQPHLVQKTAPTLDQFQYDQKAWSQAVSEWNDYQIQAGVQQALARNQQQQSQNEVLQKYTEKVDTFRKDHPDFDTVTSNPKLPSLDRMAAAMVINSDLAAELTYHLATNPEEAVRIARMNPTQQALAIGRLENKVTPSKPAVQSTVEVKPVATTPAQTKPTVPAVTQAPDPFEPIPAGGADTPSPETVKDVNEWMRLRSAEVKTRRRGGSRTIK